MKVLTEDVLCEEEQGDKNRTDVQDILAASDDSRSRVSSGLSLVSAGLLLSGANACRPCALRAARVTCVVSAARELPDTPLPHTDTPFLRVPVMDTVHDDLTPYFDLVADVIEQVRLSGGCTLVHCVAGVSRSASLCLAYLMRYSQLSLRDAFFHLREQRQQVRPNTGFFKQLIKYEEELFGKSSVKIVYNEAAGRDIPDVYEADYQNMLYYQQRYCSIPRYTTQ